MTPRPALTEIQRWSFGCSNSAAAAHMSVSKDEQGKFVLYTDHVAALASQEQRRVVEAKIAVLEEMLPRLLNFDITGYRVVDLIDQKIAALRKELGE